MRILNFGSLNIDHVYRVPRLPRPGETISAREYTTFFGGKGLNQSVATALAGASVFHAGKVGYDGGALLGFLKDKGVDTTWIGIDSGPTGHAVIYVDDDGSNEIVVAGGANRSIERSDISSVLGRFEAGDILALQNEVSEVPDLIRFGAERGMRIVFNPAPMDREVLEYPLDLVSDLIVNESEGSLLSGQDDPDSILESLVKLLPGCSIILTLGARGLLYAGGGERFRVPAYKVKVVDSTAAGDCFIGYYLAGLAAGISTLANLKRAALAAALCVTSEGAAGSIPRTADLVSITYGETDAP